MLDDLVEIDKREDSFFVSHTSYRVNAQSFGNPFEVECDWQIEPEIERMPLNPRFCAYTKTKIQNGGFFSDNKFSIQLYTLNPLEYNQARQFQNWAFLEMIYG
ncbi:MAG: hypothetical protein WC979_05810 [Candidatus Pacearchaeota archaeon]|jgi:hypothetical protein